MLFDFEPSKSKQIYNKNPKKNKWQDTHVFFSIDFLFVCLFLGLFVCLFVWQQKVGGTGAVGATAFSLAPARSEGRADSMFSYCPGEPRLRCWQSKLIFCGGCEAF